MSIPFTQYLLPDGRTRQESIERPVEVETVARSFIAAGGCFEAEMLGDGQVSLTAELGETCVAIEIVPNGPEVPNAVDRIVNETAAYLKGTVA